MSNKYKFIISILLIGLIILARLLPHWPNVAPVAAAGLVAGAYLGRRWALGVVIGGMIITDFLIGFYHWPVMLSVYLSLIFIALGSSYLMKHKTTKIVLTYSLSASLLFYLITNLAVWATANWYPKTLAGLMLAYEMGLPFLRYTLLGDLFYTVVLFTVFELVFSFFPALFGQKKLAKFL